MMKILIFVGFSLYGTAVSLPKINKTLTQMFIINEELKQQMLHIEKLRSSNLFCIDYVMKTISAVLITVFSLRGNGLTQTFSKRQVCTEPLRFSRSQFSNK